MRRYLPFVIIVAVLIVAVGVIVKFIRSSSRPSNAPANASTPSGPGVPGAEPPHVRGNPNAPVTLEEFGDFQCPSCGAYYPELKKIEAEYGERLRVIFREYPLYPTPHEHALIAAQAAEAAGLQGRFWEMHDKLYENQKPWSDARDVLPIFIQFAKELGLDADRFARDLNSDAVAARIFQDGRRAHALGVQSTPTLFVNGNEQKGLPTPEALRQALDKALGKIAGP